MADCNNSECGHRDACRILGRSNSPMSVRSRYMMEVLARVDSCNGDDSATENDQPRKCQILTRRRISLTPRVGDLSEGRWKSRYYSVVRCWDERSLRLRDALFAVWNSAAGKRLRRKHLPGAVMYWRIAQCEPSGPGGGSTFTQAA